MSAKDSLALRKHCKKYYSSSEISCMYVIAYLDGRWLLWEWWKGDWGVFE